MGVCWDTVRCKELLKDAAELARGHALVSGEARHTQRISGATVNPLTQREEGYRTN